MFEHRSRVLASVEAVVLFGSVHASSAADFAGSVQGGEERDREALSGRMSS